MDNKEILDNIEDIAKLYKYEVFNDRIISTINNNIDLYLRSLMSNMTLSDYSIEIFKKVNFDGKKVMYKSKDLYLFRIIIQRDLNNLETHYLEISS